MNESVLLANEKIAQVCELMPQAPFDGYLIVSRQGADTKFSLIFDQDTQQYAAAVFTPKGEATLLVHESEAANFEGLTGIAVVPYQGQFRDALHQVLKNGQFQRLGVNFSEDNHGADGLTLGAYALLRGYYGEKVDEVLLSAEELIDTVRAVKTPQEIARIRECIHRVEECLDVVLPQIRVGMTEVDIGKIFVQEMRKRDLTASVGDPQGPPIVSNLRGGISHRGAAGTVTMPGDTIVIDFCAWYKGFSSDLSRTTYVLRKGETKPSEQAQAFFDLVHGNITEIAKIAKAGTRGYEVNQVRLDREEAFGGVPDYGISAGHQIGRECHDGGTTFSKKERGKYACSAMRVNETYALEPSCLLFDRKIGAHIEEDILVHEDCVEFLSHRQNEIFLIPYGEV